MCLLTPSSSSCALFICFHQSSGFFPLLTRLTAHGVLQLCGSACQERQRFYNLRLAYRSNVVVIYDGYRSYFSLCRPCSFCLVRYSCLVVRSFAFLSATLDVYGISVLTLVIPILILIIFGFSMRTRAISLIFFALSFVLVSYALPCTLVSVHNLQELMLRASLSK